MSKLTAANVAKSNPKMMDLSDDAYDKDCVSSGQPRKIMSMPKAEILIIALPLNPVYNFQWLTPPYVLNMHIKVILK